MIEVEALDKAGTPAGVSTPIELRKPEGDAVEQSKAATIAFLESLFAKGKPLPCKPPSSPPSATELHKQVIRKGFSRQLYHEDPLETLRRICTVARHSTEDLGESEHFAKRYYVNLKFELLYPDVSGDWEAEFQKAWEASGVSQDGIMKVGNVVVHDFVLMDELKDKIGAWWIEYAGATPEEMLSLTKLIMRRLLEARLKRMDYCLLGPKQLTTTGLDLETVDRLTDLLCDYTLIKKANRDSLKPRDGRATSYRFFEVIPGTLIMWRKYTGRIGLSQQQLPDWMNDWFIPRNRKPVSLPSV